MTLPMLSSEVRGGAGRIAVSRGLVRGGIELVVAAAVLLGGPALVGAQEVTWAGGVDVTNGDYYFSERTTALWLTNGVTARWGGFWLDASLPLLMQNSDVVTRVAGLPVPTGGSRSGDVARRGSGSGSGDGSGTGEMRRTIEIEEPGSLELDVADPVFGAGVDLTPDGTAVRSVRFGVSAKAPVRSVESGIGTGEWDVGVGGGTSIAAGSVLVLLDGTWWSLGDLPDLELKNVFSYSAAVGGLLGDGSVGWTASVTGSTTMIDDVEAPVSVGGDVLFWSDAGSSFRAGLRFGLTESAADVAGSLGWAIPLTD